MAQLWHPVMLFEVVLPLFLCACMGAVSGSRPNQRQVLMQRDEALLNQKPARPLWQSATLSRAQCCTTCLYHAACSAVFFNPTTGSCLGFVTSTPEDDVMETAPGYQVIRLENICPIAQSYLYSPSLRLCLRVHKASKTWTAAKVACEADGEQLAMLKTLEENMFIRDYMTANNVPALHLGAQNTATGLQWVDGTRVVDSWFSTNAHGVTFYPKLFTMGSGWGTGYETTTRWYLCRRTLLGP